MFRAAKNYCNRNVEMQVVFFSLLSLSWYGARAYLICRCVTKSVQGARKLLFGVKWLSTGEVQKCQNAVRYLDLDNEVKGLRS